MAVSRYEHRHDLVVAEANAIETARQSGRAAGRALGGAKRARGGQYVEVDAARRHRHRRPRLTKLLADGELEDAAGRKSSPRKRPTRRWSSPCPSTSRRWATLADLHSQRVAARFNQIPDSLLVLLLVFAVFVAAEIGVSNGFIGRRTTGFFMAYAILVALLIGVILASRTAPRVASSR